MNNTVKLAFNGMPGVEIEGIASVAITPGMLLTKDASGEYLPHDTNAAYNLPWIAVEAPYSNKTLDTQYAIGDRVYLVAAKPGDVMYMFLSLGENAAIGDILTSSGDGNLEVGTPPFMGGSVVGITLEACDATAAITRIKVEIGS